MWGQVFDIFSAAIATGIIRTRVGTRTADYSSDALSRDHPHACGDKLQYTAESGSDRGSSPRVWGQESLLSTGYSDFRIIPTRVGTRLPKIF